jgi:hypothetical protein
MTGKNPHVSVIATTGRKADQKGYRFAFVKIGNRIRLCNVDNGDAADQQRS